MVSITVQNVVAIDAIVLTI